ncbi:MAG TPA: M20/M25/M40 family metallo-hydrolase [Pyrinomonadaceae bacterium]|nr:M20/M25/M40 family metallo-hydrolase [Pyrinomonadaceae bacterium]
MKQAVAIITLALALAAPCRTQTPSKPPEVKTEAGAASPAVDAGKLFEDVRVLSADEMEGRGAGTPGGARARSYITGRFGQTGLKPFFGASFEQPVELAARGGGKAGAGANVVGVVRGKKNPERFVVVTAHYDHLGVRNGQIYNGADDNASGVATLLALAAHFSRQPPDNSFIFAALDNEEGGGAGAKTLVKTLLEAKRDVALNVNLDMVSHSARGELYAAGTYHYPSLKPLLEKVAARAPVKLLLGHDRPEPKADDWTTQSDHGAFHKEKIPFVYFGVEDHEDYHKPSDDFGTITQDFFARAAETILEALKTFDENLSTVERPKR